MLLARVGGARAPADLVLDPPLSSLALLVDRLTRSGLVSPRPCQLELSSVVAISLLGSSKT